MLNYVKKQRTMASFEIFAAKFFNVWIFLRQKTWNGLRNLGVEIARQHSTIKGGNTIENLFFSKNFFLS